MGDKIKARDHLDNQLQMAEAAWVQRVISMTKTTALKDSWGTSTLAEKGQKSLMDAFGPAVPARPRKVVSDP